MDLIDVTKLFQQRDAMPHYPDFPRSIIDFLDADGACAASIDGAFEVLDWDELAIVTKNRPVPAEKLADLVTHLVCFVAFLHDVHH
jgi:hypothetical protein